jgi:PST family polysaccharide transporter
MIGMIFVFTNFAELFSELGLGAALVQRKTIEERHLSSIFWLNIGAGLFLTILTIILSPYLSIFYKVPELEPLAMLISFNFLISSFGIVQRSLLTRRMDFYSVLIISITVNTLSGVLGISLACFGFGVWSLAWQFLSSSVITTVLLWLLSPWKPKLIFNKNAIRELLPFSKNLLGFSVFNYWIRNVDNLLIGKYLDANALGIYSRAYNIMLLPFNQITRTIGQVMFSSLSKIQDDKEAVKKIYLRSIRAIALISFPLMMGLFVTADHFILTILGPQWGDVVPVLMILCYVGMVQSITITTGWLFTSQGRTDLQFRWACLSGFLVILSFIPGIIMQDIVILAACYAFMESVVLLYPTMEIPGRLVDLHFSELLHNIKV